MYQRTHCTRPCMCCMVVSMELCCPLILHLEYKKILYSVVQGNLSVLNTAVLPLNVLLRCSSLVTIGWVPETCSCCVRTQPAPAACLAECQTFKTAPACACLKLCSPAMCN